MASKSAKAKRKIVRVGHRHFQPSLTPLPSLAGKPPEQQLINQRAMKGEWADPEDLQPNRRAARTIVGHRGFCPLRWCLRRHKDKSSITMEHILAADQLRLLADTIAIGLSGSRDRFNLQFIQQAVMPRLGPTRIEIQEARAWRPFQRTMALFNATERDVVTHIVLLNLSVARYCAALAVVGAPRDPAVADEKKIRQVLLVCLDRLLEHFRSEVDRELQRGASI